MYIVGIVNKDCFYMMFHFVFFLDKFHSPGTVLGFDSSKSQAGKTRKDTFLISFFYQDFDTHVKDLL